MVHSPWRDSVPLCKTSPYGPLFIHLCKNFRLIRTLNTILPFLIPLSPTSYSWPQARPLSKIWVTPLTTLKLFPWNILHTCDNSICSFPFVLWNLDHFHLPVMMGIRSHLSLSSSMVLCFFFDIDFLSRRLFLRPKVLVCVGGYWTSGPHLPVFTWLEREETLMGRFRGKLVWVGLRSSGTSKDDERNFQSKDSGHLSQRFLTVYLLSLCLSIIQ